MPMWVTFESGKQACVEATDEIIALPQEDRPAALKKLAEELGKEPVTKVQHLSNPASPRLNNPHGWPSFCYRPRECAEAGRCTSGRACND